MIGIARGEPYPAAVVDGIQFAAFMPGGSLLRIALPNITKVEEQNYRKGKSKFGFVSDAGAILTLWKFGVLPWADAPFDAVAAKSANQLELADVGVDSRLLIQLHVVDSDSGICRAIRAFTLTAKQTSAFTSAIQSQFATGVSPAGMERLLSAPTATHVKRSSK